MKTFNQNYSAEIIEQIKRIAFKLELALACISIPVLFMVGINGNEHRNSADSRYEKISMPQPSNTSVIDFHKGLTDKNG